MIPKPSTTMTVAPTLNRVVACESSEPLSSIVPPATAADLESANLRVAGGRQHVFRDRQLDHLVLLFAL